MGFPLCFHLFSMQHRHALKFRLTGLGNFSSFTNSPEPLHYNCYDENQQPEKKKESRSTVYAALLVFNKLLFRPSPSERSFLYFSFILHSTPPCSENPSKLWWTVRITSLQMTSPSHALLISHYQATIPGPFLEPSRWLLWPGSRPEVTKFGRFSRTKTGQIFTCFYSALPSWTSFPSCLTFRAS